MWTARNFSPCQTAFASLNPLPPKSFEWFTFECITTHCRRREGKRRGREMRTRVDKRRSGKIADRKTRKEERKREKKRGRLKMKGEAGTISDLVYVLYEKRAKRGGGLRHAGHRAAKVTVRSGKLFESFQSFRFVSPVASRRFPPPD